MPFVTRRRFRGSRRPAQTLPRRRLPLHAVALLLRFGIHVCRIRIPLAVRAIVLLSLFGFIPCRTPPGSGAIPFGSTTTGIGRCCGASGRRPSVRRRPHRPNARDRLLGGMRGPGSGNRTLPNQIADRKSRGARAQGSTGRAASTTCATRSGARASSLSSAGGDRNGGRSSGRSPRIPGRTRVPRPALRTKPPGEHGNGTWRTTRQPGPGASMTKGRAVHPGGDVGLDHVLAAGARHVGCAHALTSSCEHRGGKPGRGWPNGPPNVCCACSAGHGTTGMREAAVNDQSLGSGYAPREADIPLRAYAGLITAFSSVGAVGFAVASRRGLPRRLHIGDLALMSVATHHAARLITKDKVTSVARSPFTEYEGSGDPGEVAERARPRRAAGDRRASDLPVLHRTVARARRRDGHRDRPTRDPPHRVGSDRLGGLGLSPGRAPEGVAGMTSPTGSPRRIAATRKPGSPLPRGASSAPSSSGPCPMGRRGHCNGRLRCGLCGGSRRRHASSRQSCWGWRRRCRRGSPR